MRTFEGCIQAKEISLTRKGANPHAHVLVRKTLEPAPGAETEPKPEKTMTTEAEKAASERAAEINKAAVAISTRVATMNDVTKAHFVALEPDAQVAFLAKSAADQDKEAEVAKAAADKVTAEEAAKAAGATAKEIDLQKRLDTQATEIETLKAAQVERDIEKRAETEFAGFPGGTAAAVPLLKAYAKLPEEARTASEALMKSQCKLAADATKALGGRTEQDISKADAAQKRLDEAAKAYAVEKKCSYGDAYEKITEDPAYAADVAELGG